MDWNFTLLLISAVVSPVIFLAAIPIYIHHRQSVARVAEREARLPEATLFIDLRQRNKDLEITKESLITEVSEAKAIIGRQEEARLWLRDNEQRYNELKAMLPEISARLEAMQTQEAELRQNVNNLAGEVAQFGAKAKIITDEIEQLNSVKSQARQEIETFSQKNDSLVKETRRLEDAKQEAESTLNKIDVLCNKSENDMVQKQTQLAAINTSIQKSQGELDVARAEHNRLKAEVDASTRLLAALGQKISTASSVAGVKADDGNRLAELWSPTLRKGLFTGNRSGESEEQCLEGVGKYLKARGLHFPQRVVNAFHTSMKVMNSSPLCVLAGISGTGKSELPRRYAEAMGIHFLNVAVQPRWDSPQDMFGFFNYLDGKYKATELARALVQMDPCAKEEGRGWVKPAKWEGEHWLSDRMLLVLLDEMNLARVEYYFSEFLSRLETRSGISNYKLVADRETAELLLEIGSSPSEGRGGQQPAVSAAMMRVFVNTNVLFVGTMNEDESTQSLSDKVIDRANVLRFGRPRSLQTPDGGNSDVQSKALPFSVWRDWCIDPDEGGYGVDFEQHLRGLDDQIQILNDAMTQVRRPFAYRTRRAVRSYVASYPGAIQNEEARNFALADQIEFKILPKFRGLDPTDSAVGAAINTVRKVLDGVGDHELSSAIKNSIQPGYHQFMWQGLNRS